MLDSDESQTNAMLIHFRLGTSYFNAKPHKRPYLVADFQVSRKSGILGPVSDYVSERTKWDYKWRDIVVKIISF